MCEWVVFAESCSLICLHIHQLVRQAVVALEFQISWKIFENIHKISDNVCKCWQSSDDLEESLQFFRTVSVIVGTVQN